MSWFSETNKSNKNLLLINNEFVKLQLLQMIFCIAWIFYRIYIDTTKWFGGSLVFLFFCKWFFRWTSLINLFLGCSEFSLPGRPKSCKDCFETFFAQFSRLSGKDLRAYLQNVTFTDPRGNLFAFDEHQDGPALYDIWRFEGIEDMAWKRTGSYADGAGALSWGMIASYNAIKS